MRSSVAPGSHNGVVSVNVRDQIKPGVVVNQWDVAALIRSILWQLLNRHLSHQDGHVRVAIDLGQHALVGLCETCVVSEIPKYGFELDEGERIGGSLSGCFLQYRFLFISHIKAVSVTIALSVLATALHPFAGSLIPTVCSTAASSI